MFTKNDLKTGMVVELKNNIRYLVVLDIGREGTFISNTGWMSMDYYTTTLELETDNSFSVVRVFDTYVGSLSSMLDNPYRVIWERNNSIDWNTIPIDTLILVRDYEDENWIPAYFAKYDCGVVSVWEDGGTSFTKKQTEAWCYAKLYEEDK